MKNPITYAYQKVDDAIMYGVNKGVRAWNWTTGQTKADLANQMLTIAPIAFGAGIFLSNPIFCFVMTPGLLAACHIKQKINQIQQEKEENAIKEGSKISPERYDDANHLGGIINLVQTPFTMLMPPIQSELFLTYTGFLSGSFYVMRAENLPPRKSVFSRAKDKLAEKLSEISQPVPQPAFVPVPSRRERLENYFAY